MFNISINHLSSHTKKKKFVCGGIYFSRDRFSVTHEKLITGVNAE